MKKYYYLHKQDIMTIYLKSRDESVYTFTSVLSEAMKFDSKDEATNYNYRHFFGECEVVEC